MAQNLDQLFSNLFISAAFEEATFLAALSHLDLAKHYTLLRQYLAQNNQREAEVLAAIQSASYTLRSTLYEWGQSRLLVALVYYQQGRRMEARQEVKRLSQELTENTAQEVMLIINIALLLAAAGDCNTAVQIIEQLKTPELRAALLPFFYQMQENFSQLAGNLSLEAKVVPNLPTSPLETCHSQSDDAATVEC